MDFFDAAYEGKPPWDIGRPQKEFAGLVRRGEITGPVLDKRMRDRGACPPLCRGRV